jgi:hypothetical protein
MFRGNRKVAIVKNLNTQLSELDKMNEKIFYYPDGPNSGLSFEVSRHFKFYTTQDKTLQNTDGPLPNGNGRNYVNIYSQQPSNAPKPPKTFEQIRCERVLKNLKYENSSNEKPFFFGKDLDMENNLYYFGSVSGKSEGKKALKEYLYCLKTVKALKQIHIEIKNENDKDILLNYFSESQNEFEVTEVNTQTTIPKLQEESEHDKITESQTEVPFKIQVYIYDKTQDRTGGAGVFNGMGILSGLFVITICAILPR